LPSSARLARLDDAVAALRAVEAGGAAATVGDGHGAVLLLNGPRTGTGKSEGESAPLGESERTEPSSVTPPPSKKTDVLPLSPPPQAEVRANIKQARTTAKRGSAPARTSLYPLGTGSIALDCAISRSLPTSRYVIFAPAEGLLAAC